MIFVDNKRLKMTPLKKLRMKITWLLATLILAACSNLAPAITPTPSRSPSDPAGNDITVQLLPGDVTRGEVLVEHCTYCHYGSNAVGPLWEPEDGSPGVGALAATRYQDDNYSGQATTPDQYLFESIVLPSVYVVDGFEDKMRQGYGGFINAQDMADIIAYLLTLQ
jgi:cytochrome c2